MKVEVNRSELAQALATVGKAAAGKRTTLAILQGVEVRTTSHGEVQVSATNLELAMNMWVKAQVLEEGTAVFSSLKQLQAMLKALSGDEVVLSGSKSEGSVKDADVDASVEVSDPEDYVAPEAFEVCGQAVFTVRAGELARVLDRTLQSVSQDDDSRPVLAAMLFQPQPDRDFTVMASADGFQLSQDRLLARMEGKTPMLVPGSTLKVIRGLIGKHNQDQTIVVSRDPQPNRFRATFQVPGTGGDLMVHTRLIDGNFPNYNQIIPTSWDTELVVDTQKLVKAIDMTLARTTGSEDTSQPLLGISWSFGESLARFTLGHVGNAKATTRVQVHGTGKPGHVYVDPKRLRSLVAPLAGPVRLGIQKPDQSIVVQEVGDPALTHVLMPMFVKDR